MDRRTFLQSTAGGVLLFGGATSGWALPLAPKIKWYQDLKLAHKAAVQHERPMLILFSATWCKYCHKLIRETLGEKEMVTWVSERFIPVLLDFDQDAKAAKILGVESLPSTTVLSPKADMLLQSVGFQKAPAYKELLQSALDKQVEIQQAGASAPR